MKNKIDELILELNNLNLHEKVDAINLIRSALHECSPFKDEPVDLIEWVRNDLVFANDYNPNSVKSLIRCSQIQSIPSAAS